MSARCFVCKRDWRDAKPFVEGADGFLICRRCVNDLQSQLALRVDHSASPLPSTELQVDDNPYASPIATDLAAACDLCGGVFSDESVLKNGRAKLCRECVVAAKRIVDAC
jgi:hypothetical protein